MNEKTMKELGRKLDTQEARAEFIREAESGIYGGKTDDGLEVQVYLDKGIGMRVFIEQRDQPRWWEVIEYDSEGYQEGVTYEPRGRGE